MSKNRKRFPLKKKNSTETNQYSNVWSIIKFVLCSNNRQLYLGVWLLFGRLLCAESDGEDIVFQFLVLSGRSEMKGKQKERSCDVASLSKQLADWWSAYFDENAFHLWAPDFTVYTFGIVLITSPQCNHEATSDLSSFFWGWMGLCGSEIRYKLGGGLSWRGL